MSGPDTVVWMVKNAGSESGSCDVRVCGPALGSDLRLARLDEELLGVDWRTFRRTFIEHGGDGLYGLWVPVHLEPVFRDLSFHGTPERAPHHDPRYRGTVKAYRAGDCPVAERLRRSACLFKTGSQTLAKVDGQLEALQRTIRHYG